MKENEWDNRLLCPVDAGLSRAKAEGKRLGRPTLDRKTEAKVRELRANGMGIVKVAKTLGIGVSAVQRITTVPLPACA